MKRNPAIELYRVVLMYGICLFHAVVSCGHNISWVNNLLCPCVVGFVFVSGWFGVRFSWTKIVRLVGLAVLWATVATVFEKYYMGVDGGLLAGIWRQATSYWFLNAYILMMCMVPLVEQIDFNRWQALVPFFLLVFGLGWLSHVNTFNSILPTLSGLEPFSGITLFGIYLVARVLRTKRIDERLTASHAFLLFVLTGVAIAVFKFGSYNSPFAVVFATLGFVLFSKIRVRPRLGRIILCLSPSMFAIYLLHVSHCGLTLMKTMEDNLIQNAVPIAVVYLLVAFAGFIPALCIDLLRRSVLSLISDKVYNLPSVFLKVIAK